MNSTLPLKINDYCRYVSLAVKYYKETSYPDAAINCRKAAEAACKIIIHNAYNEKLAETKLNGKSLKELIILLIHEGLTERKTINTLETLQIIGNKAAHDNTIGKDETSYAIHALNLFTEYLFKEHLKISIPKTLDFIFAETKEIQTITQTEVIEKIIVHEKFNKETEEELFSKIKDIEQKSEGDSAKFEELKTELLFKVQELSQKKHTEEEIRPVEKKNSLQKIGLLILISLLVILGAALLLNYFLKEKRNVQEKTFQLTKHPDSIYVAVNNFQVLQDNPNIDYKIEQIIYNRINNLRLVNNLPISLVTTNYRGNGEKEDSVLINKAQRAGFDLVYFGNLYETALTDSNILEITSSVTRKENRIARYNRVKFKNLGDSTIIKEVIDQGNMPVLLYAENPKGKSDKQMLALTQGLKYYSKEQYSSIYNFIACFKRNLGDYKGALKDLDRINRINPNNAYFLAFKANLFAFDKQLDSSKLYFEKSLKIDSTDVNTLANYGSVCVTAKEFAKAESLFKRAIFSNPDNYFPYLRIAALKMEQKEYALAKYYGLKADNLFKGDAVNTIMLANIYGFVDYKKDSAEYFYNRVIGRDSTNTDGLNALASYYQRFFQQDPVYKLKVSQLLAKVKVLKTQNDLSTDYNFGMATFANRDYKAALIHFEKIYVKNYFDNEVLTCMAQAYYHTKQPEKALLFGKKAFDLDSVNTNNLVIYAYLLSYIHPEDFKKVDYYFKKAWTANPAFLDIFQQYGTYLSHVEKNKECIDLTLKGYKLFPADLRINSLLAYSYMNLKDFHKTKPYFEFLVSRLPDNDTLLCDYAQCLLQEFHGTPDDNFVYGARLAKKASDLNSNNPNYQLVFALYCLKGNNPKLAAEYYLKVKDLSKNTIYNEELEKLTYKMIQEGQLNLKQNQTHN